VLVLSLCIGWAFLTGRATATVFNSYKKGSLCVTGCRQGARMYGGRYYDFGAIVLDKGMGTKTHGAQYG
jgi:hypothetical protein